MTHIMLDLETFGVVPGSALRSIGAVVFSPHEEGCGEGFYYNISRQSCLDAGLSIDPKTEAWWLDQERVAQDALMVDPHDLRLVANNFHGWFVAQQGVQVWCQGANFDAPLWEAAVAAIGLSVPWRFYAVRDTRTVYDVFGFDTSTLAREGIYHNALDDAKHQARCVQMAIKKGLP